MKLKYETGIATFVQFAAVSLLALANQINAIVVGCIHSDCVSNIIPSIGYFIVTAILFAGIWILGWFAQEKRSRWLAVGLIGVELLVVKVAEHNAKQHTDILSLISSLINLALAVWIIYLAVRLAMSGGGRVVSRQRPRQRRRRTPTNDQ
jgi:hypothetical protein